MTSPVPAEPSTSASRHAQRAGAPSGADPTAPATRPRPVLVVATVLVALALSAAAGTGERVIEVVVIVVAGLIVALGWPCLIGSGTPVGTTVVLGVTALGLGGALLGQDVEPYLEHVPAAIALGIIAMCLHPLVQASARTDLARTLAGTALGVLLVGGGGLMISTVFTDNHGPVVVVGIALAVAALVDLALERPSTHRWLLPVGMLVGGVVAILAHWILSGSLAAWPALLGVTAAGTAVALRRAAAQLSGIDSVPGALGAGAAAVLVVAPLVHLVARLPLG